MGRIDEGLYEGLLSSHHRISLRVGRHDDGRLENVSGDLLADTEHVLSFLGRRGALAENNAGHISGSVSFFTSAPLASIGGPIELMPDRADDGTVAITLDLGDGPVSARLERTGDHLRGLHIDIDGLEGLPAPVPSVFEGGQDGQDMVSALRRASIAATVKVEPFRPDASGRRRHTMAELHALMEDWNRPPQGIDRTWRLHVLLANRFDGRNGDDVTGIMYDVEPGMGPPRQGLAVFLNSNAIKKCLPANSPDWCREVLFTLVHEIGHALNLPHAFEDQRQQALTWMNYPDLIDGGPDGFWNAFQHAFDDPELSFLRHAPFSDIAPGRHPYAWRDSELLSGGSLPALLRPKQLTTMADPAVGRLALAIEPLKPVYTFGEPVFLKLSVTNNGRKPVRVAKALDPSDGYTVITVHTPSGKVRRLRPPAALCQHAPTTSLGYRKSVSFDGILASFDADGVLFDEPGRYRIQATFSGAPGVLLTALPTTLRVLHPTRSEEHFAITIWDDPALMRAIYYRQPLIALDRWQGLVDGKVHLIPSEGENTTSSYLRYLAAMGWLSPFAPASRAKALKANRRKAVAHLRAVDPSHLPSGVRLKKEQFQPYKQG